MKFSMICFLFMALNAVPVAHAADDTTRLACGNDRAKGAAAAEVGLVDGEDPHFYLNGVEQPEGKFIVNGRDNGYIVNMGDQQFRFTIKPGDVQELNFPLKGPAKKVGDVKTCIVHLMEI